MLRRYYRWRGAMPVRFLYHSDFFHVRRLLEACPEEMAGVAEQRLRHVLDNAIRHVPFYRCNVKLSSKEIAMEPCGELLKCFPYIGKAEVMNCQRDFLDERLDTRRLVYAVSHGSSGQGIGVWRTKREADIEKAFYTHEWGRLGFSFNKSRYLRIGADAARPIDDGPTWILGNRLMLSPNHILQTHKEAILARVNQFKPEYIHSYPSCALSLAELLTKGDLDFIPRGILLASQPATPLQLSSIEQVFQCPIAISYGLTERTNLAFARHVGGASGPYLFQPL
jgi:phenylacetate-CoA ligase